MADSSKKNQRGFTLIEFAVSMVVLALFIAAAIPLYSLYIKEKAADTTRKNQAAVYYAILSYKERLSKYPCPSSLTATPDEAKYGVSATCPQTAVAPGLCVDGLCAEQGPLQITREDGTLATAKVIRGAVPFQTLSLSEDQAYDGYGRRFVYVVTEDLTDAELFNEDRGGIQVVDANDVPLTNPNVGAGGTHFVLISGGEDGEGFYTRSGVMEGTCNTATLEGENCDTTPQSVYRVSTVNAAGNNQDFDDFVVYNAIREPSLWRYNGLDITDTTKGNVGIGIHPQMGEKLAVDGTLRVDPSNPMPPRAWATLAATYCEQGNKDCFDPSVIAVGKDCTQIDPSYGMIGFDKGQIVCGPIKIGCPNGEYITGFDSAGIRICGPIVPPKKPCEAKTVPICTTDSFTLPKTDDGKTVTATSIMGNRREIYACNDGVWSLQSTAGVCTCKPVTSAQIVDTKICKNLGMVGTRITVNVTTCAPYKVTSVIIQDCTVPVNCGAETRTVCAGTPVATPVSLPASAHGTVLNSVPAKIGYSRKDKFTCNSGNWDQTGTGDCEAPLKCPATTMKVCDDMISIPETDSGKTYTQPSPSGYDRIEQFKCTNGVWSSSGGTGSCTIPPACDALAVKPCPAGDGSYVFAFPASAHATVTSTGKYGEEYKCVAGTWSQTKSPSCPKEEVCTWTMETQGFTPQSSSGGYDALNSECNQDGSEKNLVDFCFENVGGTTNYHHSCRCTCQFKN